MNSSLERVYTIDDWYDGARQGVADYRGRPHAYRSLYLDSATWDPDEDRFELVPASDEMRDLMIERDALFQRWEAAFREGRTPQPGENDLPVLPEDRTRYVKLQERIAAALECAGPRFVVRGRFEYGAEHGPARASVRWRPLDSRG